MNTSVHKTHWIPLKSVQGKFFAFLDNSVISAERKLCNKGSFDKYGDQDGPLRVFLRFNYRQKRQFGEQLKIETDRY